MSFTLHLAVLSQVIGFQIKRLLISRIEEESPPSASAGHMLAQTLVWLALSVIMVLVGISVVHGSESRKGILNYRENWCLKRQQFTDVCIFFHSEIFLYSLPFISIRYGWLLFLRNSISLYTHSRFCK